MQSTQAPHQKQGHDPTMTSHPKNNAKTHTTRAQQETDTPKTLSATNQAWKPPATRKGLQHTEGVNEQQLTAR